MRRLDLVVAALLLTGCAQKGPASGDVCYVHGRGEGAWFDPYNGFIYNYSEVIVKPRTTLSAEEKKTAVCVRSVMYECRRGQASTPTARSQYPWGTEEAHCHLVVNGGLHGDLHDDEWEEVVPWYTVWDPDALTQQ